MRVRHNGHTSFPVLIEPREEGQIGSLFAAAWEIKYEHAVIAIITGYYDSPRDSLHVTVSDSNGIIISKDTKGIIGTVLDPIKFSYADMYYTLNVGWNRTPLGIKAYQLFLRTSSLGLDPILGKTAR